jgi:hypothetical protein
LLLLEAVVAEVKLLLALDQQVVAEVLAAIVLLPELQAVARLLKLLQGLLLAFLLPLLLVRVVLVV